MPFKSDKQRKACFATKGFNGAIDCRQWAKEGKMKKKQRGGWHDDPTDAEYAARTRVPMQAAMNQVATPSNSFNWRGQPKQQEQVCPPGWTWSAPDNMCVQQRPTINTRDMNPQISAPEDSDYSDMMQAGYNPNAATRDVGVNWAPQDPENAQILDMGSKQKGNNKLLDPYFALQGLETGLAWLGGKRERNRQDQYMYNQYNTLGQNAPVNVQDYQPNRFSMYARYGGKLRKKQAGGRLVDKVPAGYTPVPGQPNYFSRTTESAVQGNVSGRPTGPQASNQQWSQFLASPAGQQWQAKQRQTDTVYTRQPAPTQPMQPRVQPLRGTGNEYMWTPTDGIKGAQIMGSLQDVVRDGPNNLLAGTQGYTDVKLFQDMNNLAQPVGQPFPISRSEVFGTGAVIRPDIGRQKLDSSRNAYQQKLAMAMMQKRLGGKMKSKYRGC